MSSFALRRSPEAAPSTRRSAAAPAFAGSLRAVRRESQRPCRWQLTASAPPAPTRALPPDRRRRAFYPEALGCCRAVRWRYARRVGRLWSVCGGFPAQRPLLVELACCGLRAQATQARLTYDRPIRNSVHGSVWIADPGGSNRSVSVADLSGCGEVGKLASLLAVTVWAPMNNVCKFCVFGFDLCT